MDAQCAHQSYIVTTSVTAINTFVTAPSAAFAAALTTTRESVKDAEKQEPDGKNIL